MTERNENIECLGLRCPEPILRTAKAARALGPDGGTLTIRADDDAFPVDLKSWCKSSRAELVSLEQREHEFRAVVRVPRRDPAAGTASLPPRAPSVSTAPTPPTSAGIAPPVPAESSATPSLPPEAKVLDYRGRRCPEPVIELAKAARTTRGALIVLADDPAFPLDLKSWCKSSGATSEDLPSEGGVYRVLVFPKGVTREALARTLEAPPGASTAAPDGVTSAAAPAPPATPPAPQPSAAPSTAPITAPIGSGAFSAGIPTARFDLRTLPAEALESELAQIGRLRPGTGITLLVPTSFAQRAVRWCTVEGHELRAYAGGEQVDLVIGNRTAPAGTSAIVPVRGDDQYDCALLVMHNDLEALLGALLVANTAAAQGMRTMVFFTFWGLNLLRADRPNLSVPAEPVSFMQRVFKWLMPKGPRRQALGQLNFAGAGAMIMNGIMRGKNIKDLPALLASAEEQQVEFIACTMSMAVMGITKRDLRTYARLQFGGVATFVSAGRGAQLSLVF